MPLPAVTRLAFMTPGRSAPAPSGEWDFSDIAAANQGFHFNGGAGLTGTDPITAWADQYGNIDVDDTTDGPSNTAPVLNSLPGLLFDGSEFLRNTSINTSSWQPYAATSGTSTMRDFMFWALCDDDSGLSAIETVFAAEAGTSGRIGCFKDNNDTTMSFMVNGFSGRVSNNGWSVGLHILSGYYIASTGEIGLKIDGNAAATTTTTASASVPTVLYVGAGVGGGGVTQQWDGSIYRLVATQNYYNAADLIKGEGRLAHDYGQTGLLPGGHAYKTNPPTV